MFHSSTRSFVSIRDRVMVITCFVLVLLEVAHAHDAPNTIALSPANAAPTSLVLDGQKLSLPEGGGFSIYDATAQKPVALPAGTLSETSGHPAFASATPELALKAEFVPQDNYILVRGEIENLKGDDRGYIVDYRIPRASVDAAFGYGLEESVSMDRDNDQEANAFPIGAMTNATDGVAVAIPPSEPRDFGVVGGKAGLGIRFYLGTTAKTHLFPNRASFVFIIYRSEPTWGFRSALSRYYGFFPDYYTPRLKKEGLFMYQMGARTPANVDQYGFDLVEMQWDAATMKAAIARDQANGITTFPYSLVGQREIKFLPALPGTYEEAMSTVDHWTLADQKGHPLTKENATDDGDAHVKEEIASSACQYADGHSAIMIRNTVWGAKSITFKANPNPNLFSGQQVNTVGGDQLKLDAAWLAQYPVFGGVFVDSLGANWPALYNYRADHFAYATYPLTVDGTGRIALQNTTSHYEFIAKLRDELRKTNRLVIGNGIYTYVAKGGALSDKLKAVNFDGKANEFGKGDTPPEDYHGAGVKLGRFFICSLLDAATCEVGIKSTVALSQDNRVMMGKKTYAYINYNWKDAAAIQEFVNKALAFGIYASSTTDYFHNVPYEDNPGGYLRDKQLLDWYVPLVRKLSTAGWEPVRDAAVQGTQVSGERFGSGNTVYFTLYNDSTTPQTGSLAVDLKSLGFTDKNAAFHEIAHSVPLQSSGPGSIRLLLPPKTTYIVSLTKNS